MKTEYLILDAEIIAHKTRKYMEKLKKTNAPLESKETMLKTLSEMVLNLGKLSNELTNIMMKEGEN